MKTQPTFEPHEFAPYVEAENICCHCDRGKYALHHRQPSTTPPASGAGSDQPAPIDTLLDAAIYADDIDRRVAARVRIKRLLEQRSTLIEQRERLIATGKADALKRELLINALITIRDSFWSENEPYAYQVEQLQDIARDVLTTIEQEGETR